MSSDRPTVRPVTLARLAEVTHICESRQRSTEFIEDKLDVTHRRARETILEAQRIDLLNEGKSSSENQVYQTTEIGLQFVHAIRMEEWKRVSEILSSNSPQYRLFLQTFEGGERARLGEILSLLHEIEDPSYTFNETSVEVLGDWAERLGILQRNAFTGDYYPVQKYEIPHNFASSLLSVFDGIEQTAGANLRQRYLSIPELREHTCEELFLTRAAFDSGLLELVNQNIGKLELSGAPIDTGAKEAELGIKQITASDDDGIVTTSQSTEQVMAGVEQFDKQYYYLAVYDCDLQFNHNNE